MSSVGVLYCGWWQGRVTAGIPPLRLSCYVAFGPPEPGLAYGWLHNETA